MTTKIRSPRLYGANTIDQPTGTAQLATTSSSSITSTQVNAIIVAVNKLAEAMATAELTSLGAS